MYTVKIFSRFPQLINDFLGQVLAILGCERVRSGDLEHGPAVLDEPPPKQRFLVFAWQAATALPVVLVARNSIFLHISTRGGHHDQQTLFDVSYRHRTR